MPSRTVPQVSVIIPARDVGDYIAPVLTDLERQTFTDMEVIVVDDGSTDGTLEVIEGFVERDARFRQLSSGGKGVSTARNVGIDHASGEFLAFVDADDRVAPQYLERLHETITETGSDLASCNALRLEGFETNPSILHQRACGKTVLKTHLSRSTQLIWDTTVWNKLWRREMWDRAGLRYAEGRWLNDFFPTMRGHVCSRTVDVINDPLYFWRIRTDPTTSITDSRLTDPVARLKSFDDRMFAMSSARRMIAEELPEPQVIRSFDLRVLRSDLPIYLPYYVGADDAYRSALVSHIHDLLVDFDIQPDRFPLGSLLHDIYQAIRERDHGQLDLLLSADTLVTPSQTRRQRTELVLAGAQAQPAASRWAGVAQRVRRQPSPPQISADVRVDRIALDPERPSEIVIHGVTRVREGRSNVIGDWSIAAGLEGTRKAARAARLSRAGKRAVRAAQRLQGAPVRTFGEAAPLAPAPDEVLHPLVRSGWQQFTARLDLSAVRESAGEREWELAFQLRAGRLELVTSGKLTKETGRYLPGGFRVADGLDLVPVVNNKSGRLSLRAEKVLAEVTEVAADGPQPVLRLSYPAAGGDAAAKPSRFWLQTPDRRHRTEAVTGTQTVALPIPEFTKDGPQRYELWCETAGGRGRVRAHAALRTARIPAGSGRGKGEVVLRPTAQGRLVMESRPRQLELTWLLADEAPGYFTIGGTGHPKLVGRSAPTLTLSCQWTEERIEVPIREHPDGWQASVDTSALVADEPAANRSWAMQVATASGAAASGATVPLQVPAERRELLPLQDKLIALPVQVRVGEQSVPVLWVGKEREHSRWRQFRKIQRSAQQTASTTAGEGDAGEEGDLASETLLRQLTAPQRSRSMTAVEPPSFRAKVDQRVRRRRYLLRHTGIVPVTEPLINKLQRDRILLELGLPLPAKLLDHGSVDDVFDTLAHHDEAVVKPISGATGKGVFLLRRTGAGWLDLRTGTVMSADELRTTLATTVSRRRAVSQWQVEELVAGSANDLGHPMDFKLYMFQERHGLTVQAKRVPEGTRFKFYDAQWRPVDIGRDEQRVDLSLPLPAEPTLLVEQAAAVSRILPLPFIRIDLIAGQSGLRLGEVTPMPGRYHRMADSVDRELGLLWEIAELEHGSEFLTAQRFQPALDAIRKVSGATRLYPD